MQCFIAMRNDGIFLQCTGIGAIYIEDFYMFKLPDCYSIVQVVLKPENIRHL